MSPGISDTTGCGGNEHEHGGTAPVHGHAL